MDLANGSLNDIRIMDGAGRGMKFVVWTEHPLLLSVVSFRDEKAVLCS